MHDKNLGVLRKGQAWTGFVRKTSIVSLSIWVAASGVNLAAAQEADVPQGGGAPIEVVADKLEYFKDQKKVVAAGNVVVSHKNYKLSADRAEVFTDLRKAYAEGHVVLSDGASSLSSNKGYYDFGKHQGAFPKGTVYGWPWYGYGEQIDQVTRNQVNVYNAIVTTCDFENPHYDLKAERATFYPDDRLVLRNLFIRVLERPVFWLPYLTIPLKNESPVEIVPGHSDELGYYVRTAKGMSLGKKVQWKPHVDFFSEKGLGLGVDVKYRLGDLGLGSLRFYEIKDRHSPDPQTRLGAPYQNRVRRRRGWANVRHFGRIKPDTTVFVNWHELSDEFFLRDLFEQEDRRETQPQSQVIVTKNTRDYGFVATVRKRTNRFVSENEELPRLRFTWKNKRLFDTNLFYTHEDELVNFNQKSKRSAEDLDVVRMNTTHEWSYPFSFRRIRFNPYFNVRQGYYSKDLDGKEHITRNLIGNGLEAKTMFYRLFDVTSRALGIEINQMRHLVEPSFRYDAIRHQTGTRDRLIKFDSFDGVQLQDSFRFGVENRLQTKRDYDGVLNRVDLVSYAQFLTYELKPQNADNESTFTDWDHRFEVRPYDWLVLRYETVYNFAQNEIRFRNFDFVVTTLPVEFVMSHSVSKDILDRDPESRQFVSDIEYNLNERWKLGAFIRADLQKDNEIEEWEVRAIRDMHDFLLTFGLNVRTSNVSIKSSHDKEVFFQFTMKAFPIITVENGNRALFSRPRIGRLITGSNVQSATKEEYFYYE